MSLRIDLHCHTRRHSGCSAIDEYRLIDRAVQRGLHGLVITEHHYQWSEDELDELREKANAPGFVLMAAFEYSSSRGDILMYGLAPEQVKEFVPGGDPEEALERAIGMGAACIAAHPTRAQIPFDDRIARMPFHGLETRSVNLEDHEQRLAIRLADNLGIPPTASSDAHRLDDIAAYATEFDDPIQCMADLRAALIRGRFRPTERL